MRVIIFGADGYLGWPTSMKFASDGHDVIAVDNYLRRHIAKQTDSEPLMENPKLDKRSEIYNALTGKMINVEIGDCTDYRFVKRLFKQYQPDAVVHYAEQPSAPYSMMGQSEASLTLRNNLDVTLNIIFGVIEESPDCHIIKLGTMGEYGTPNIDIEEGWIEINHNGRKDTFLYPRQTGSLYHTTKIMDTDLLWFYVRTYGLKVTDLMQGPVYGLSTLESDLQDDLLPNFHYDDIFGTALNRFLVQAVVDIQLTVYGAGGQTRGYLNINDTMECVSLSLEEPPKNGDLRIFNQFTETFSVNTLAGKIKSVGNHMNLNVKIKNYPNPRKEAEDHYYNPKHTGLLELGLKPTLLTDDIIHGMLEKVVQYKSNIVTSRILPRVIWHK